MSHESENLFHTMMKLTYADSAFNQMVDHLLARVRAALGAPPVDESGKSSDPLVDEEFVKLRQRLQGFFPEYEDIYRRTLLKHLGDANLAPAVAALQSQPMLTLFQALRAMGPELADELQGLTQRMGATQLFES